MNRTRARGGEWMRHRMSDGIRHPHRYKMSNEYDQHPCYDYDHRSLPRLRDVVGGASTFTDNFKRTLTLVF
jgi:hypothetical protein